MNHRKILLMMAANILDATQPLLAARLRTVEVPMVDGYGFTLMAETVVESASGTRLWQRGRDYQNFDPSMVDRELAWYPPLHLPLRVNLVIEVPLRVTACEVAPTAPTKELRGELPDYITGGT
jgi:hypothetical protein